jgi:hypothetical protein
MAEVDRSGNVKKLGAGEFMAMLVAMLVSLAALAPQGARAADAAATLSEQDQTCLACHAQKGLKKRLASGETLSLQVSGQEFAQSVHGAIGCAACHSDVNLESHPRPQNKLKTLREYAVARTEACTACHEDKVKLYQGSIHETLVRAGNAAAPLCSDCHSPHAVRPKSVADAITGLSCKKCHEPIFDAYKESMHGQARGKLGHVQAPICADCHRAHDVGVASVGNRLKEACLACHANAVNSHRAWLPNAGRHLEAVSCAACHAPTAQRRVDLRLYDSVAQKQRSEAEGLPRLEDRARSANGNGLDAAMLWNLLREYNRDRGEGRTVLRGRLEVRTGVEAHQLADKSQAVKDCISCHRDGADPFQTVTVSVVGPDGRQVRYDAHKDVLNAPLSVDAVRGFYAVGGTRVKLLDAVLGLALVGGLAVPVGHQTLRWFIRRRLARAPQPQGSEKNRADAPPETGGGKESRDARK